MNFTDTSTNSPSTWAWWFGDEQYNNAWINTTTEPVWTARSEQGATVLPDGLIVVAGGHDAGGSLNDTWVSFGGYNSWDEQNASSGWSARSQQSLVGMPDGTLVLMAGYKGSHDYNDVWSSVDEGITWYEQTANADWTRRMGQSVVSTSDNKLILTGGIDEGYTYYNDTWISLDHGATWTEQNSSSGWPVRADHRMVITPDDTIILMGGGDAFTDYNDTWISTDLGVTWTEVNPSSGWTPRISFGAVAIPNGDIMLMGGEDFSMNIYADVWVSQNNGTTWIEVTPASWTPRVSLSATATPDGFIEVMGGSDTGGLTEDIWENQVAGDITANPYHLFTTTGIYPVMLQVHNLEGTDSIRHNITAGSYILPHANFNWSQPNLSQPLQISFHDLSNNTPTGWSWFFGDEPYTESLIHISDFPGSAPTGSAHVILPNGHIVLMGGFEGYNVTNNEVWMSADNGTTWHEQTAHAEWDPRWDASAVSLSDGSIVISGGFKWSNSNILTGYNCGIFSDTWISTDEGITWTEQSPSAGWGGRAGASEVMIPGGTNGTIVLMGGMNIDPGIGNWVDYRNDVWFSQDKGVTWYLLNASAGWGARAYMGSTVLENGSIILSGGHRLNADPANDTWISNDYGGTWTEQSSSASWPGYAGLSLVAMPDSSIVLIGGETMPGGTPICGLPVNTHIWRSTDEGITWIPTVYTPFLDRPFASVLGLRDGSILSIGGQDNAGCL